MSSTNRGGKRSEADFYSTPEWVIERLLEKVSLPGGQWLEPCAGTGAIPRTVASQRKDVQWTACELRAECELPLSTLVGPENVRLGDFLLEPLVAGSFDVIITNPPFRLALPFIEKCIGLGGTVVMLLRLNFLASGERQAFMKENPPDVYVLPNRPSFKGEGKTDSIEYGWFVWETNAPKRKSGAISVLETTPKSIRRATRTPKSTRGTKSP